MRVFISHQWRDKQVADRLARDLEPLAEVWIDFRGLHPGDRIQESIDGVLANTDLVLLVWTEHARRSSGVRAEIEACLRNEIRLVPCILAHDERGGSDPPLDAPLDQILGIDFHHYGTGLAQVAELILHLQRERLPTAAPEHENPGVRMVRYLRGYLHYLANYRTVQGVPDQRSEWVGRILGEIEGYVRDGGNTEAVRALLRAARQGEGADPEGIGMLVTRLEAVLAELSPGGRTPVPTPSASPAPSRERSASAPDALQRGIAATAPPGAADEWQRQVDTYLASAPVALQALTSAAGGTGSQAGAQVVSYLEGYLARADDLVPDHQGQYGRLDDAWLILNTAFRLIESGVIPVAAIPVDWPGVIAADHVVRALIPPEALDALSAAVFEMLEMIAAEIAAYQPWFARDGRGYSPVVPAPSSSGGTWEDQMNKALLGTGLSVDSY